MKKLPAPLLLIGLSILPLFASAQNNVKTRFSPGLEKVISSPQTISRDSLIDVLVIMENTAVQDRIANIGGLGNITQHDRIKSVAKELRNFRPAGYDKVKSFLEINSSNTIQSYWIIPAFSAKLPLSKIEELNSFDGISLVVEDARLSFDPPVETAPAPALSTSVSTHLQILKVPQLWSQGLTGRGRLVCSFDTGVDVGHPALAAKWRGHTKALSSSWFSVVEPDSLPNDNVGHGTHTMGVMVGLEGADTIGVAFDAQWITAGVIDQGRPLSSTISDILGAFQWALNPDGNFNTTDDVPDVILNSWGIPKGLFTPCDPTFWAVIDNVEAAGIVTIFAAGNEGPGAKTIRSPADRATSPLNSFCVGAVDNSKVVGSFSSRGPSSCDTSQHKPEVVAPGVNVRSSIRGGGYGFMTGTSMAAPFIAGLVPLIRQFNPNATVSQIKNAILLSCEDLGPFGDDNTYGYGLPDASKILSFIPPPATATFSVLNQVITENISPFPGDSFHLRLTLAKQSGSVTSIGGRLSTINSSDATVTADRSNFFFGGIGSSAVSIPDFQINYSENVTHGQNVDFLLELLDGAGNPFDSLFFSMTAGIAPRGAIGDQFTSRINFSVSDFGQYGFGPNSIYNAGGEGFRIDNGPNLLYESGIIVGRNQLQLSSSIRDSLGNLKASDFGPTQPLKSAGDIDGGDYMAATIRDTYSQIVIPITVFQKSKTYSATSENGFVIFEYWLYNHTLENINSLYFGLLTDFDMGLSGDNVQLMSQYQMAYSQSSNGQAIGIVGLKNVNGYSYVTNGAAKTGLTRQQQFNAISGSAFSTLPPSTSDALTITRSGPFNLTPGDSAKIALAIVIGSNTSELIANAMKAQNAYNLSTDIADEPNILPNEFILHQNYPNPFNPTTTISFELNKKQKTDLFIYNMLGQKVKTLFSGELSAGTHRIEWNALDDSGQKVASGIYFYKLVAEEQVASRKMTLLK